MRLILGSIMAVSLAGCASTYPLTAGPQVPAAQGTVQAKTGDNGNTKLKLSVAHLAIPDRITPGSSVFVVWARAPEAQAQNLGTLRVDKDLQGTLETVTPLRNFELSVTPEASAATPEPSGPAVLRTSINLR